MTPTFHEPAPSEGQLIELDRFLADLGKRLGPLVLERAGPTKEGLQRALSRGDELADAIAEAAVAKFRELSASDRYKGGEVASTFGYLSGYLEPKGVGEQLRTLATHFPELAGRYVSPMRRPEDPEGIFIIPHWSLVAATYPGAVAAVLKALSLAYRGKFQNYREGEVDATHLRERTRKVVALQQLRQAQENVVLQMPAQFGIAHRGRSVRQARAMFASGEFGLGAWEVGCMLLTHPERLAHADDLWINCAGDEWQWTGEYDWSNAPFFYFHDGKLKFAVEQNDRATPSYGPATGFVPQ